MILIRWQWLRQNEYELRWIRNKPRRSCAAFDDDSKELLPRMHGPDRLSVESRSCIPPELNLKAVRVNVNVFYLVNVSVLLYIQLVLYNGYP